MRNFFRKLLVSMLGFSTFLLCAEPPPDVAWARKAGSSDTDQGRAVAVDTNGNIYVTGFFSGTTSFGPTNLTSSGTEDIFVAKYTAAGTLLWVRKAGGASYDEGRGIAVDANGNVYVTGLFQGTATFTSTNMSSSGESDVFLAKYNNQGTLLWVRKGGGNSFDEAHALALDPASNVYVTGSFDATAVFGSTMLTNISGFSDIFVARWDGNGTFIWARRAGGVRDDSGNGLALDAHTNVYVTGSFSSNAAFASTNLLAPGVASDIFIAKYTSAGALTWVRQAGGTNQDIGNAIAIDASGNMVVVGQFRVAASFSGTNVLGSGADIFVARYNTDGNPIWVQKAGGNDSIYGDQATAVQLDAAGNAYVTGHFSGTANFGNTNIATSAFNDVFVAKYATNGQPAWVTRLGGSGIDVGYALALDRSNNVIVTGFFYQTLTAGTTNMTSSGLDDVFIAQLAPTTAPRLIITRAGANIVLSWPSAARGFTLESALVLPTNNWSVVSPPPATNGLFNVVTQSTGSADRFFRLHAP
jgi:hypothetical protein